MTGTHSQHFEAVTKVRRGPRVTVELATNLRVSLLCRRQTSSPEPTSVLFRPVSGTGVRPVIHALPPLRIDAHLETSNGRLEKPLANGGID